MPTTETTRAQHLLHDLESYWISLLLWVADRSDTSPDDLIAPLGYGAARAAENFAKEIAKLGGQTDGFTVIHFLDFAGYFETASLNHARFQVLGQPPQGWRQRLADQNRDGAVRYRNHLAHGNRFDLLPLSQRRHAIDLFEDQLTCLRQWWPGCPVHPQSAQSDENPIRGALRLLGPDPNDAVPLAEALGMRSIPNARNLTPIGDPSSLARALEGAASRLYRVGEVAAGPTTAALYLVYLDQWPERSAQRERVRRKVAKALVEQQQQDPRWIAILLDGDGASPDVEFILPRAREKKGIGTVRATVTPQDPSRYHIDLLEDLRVRPPVTLLDLTRQWNDAFNVERVTNDFYRELHDLRNRLIDALLAANPDNPALASKNPNTDKGFALQLNAFATRQLSRLLFLWFLQQKRWLGGDPGRGSPTFLIEQFTDQGRPRPESGDSFYNDVLVPVFFDGLGRHLHDDRHIDLANRVGEIPYLDGGLFRPDADPFERDLFDIGDDGIPTRRVSLPDDLFDPSKDQPVRARRATERQRTVLGLLRGYRFTTQESTPDDQSVDPDPELLGKVFENLYQEDDRHQTGAYYTPREIVHYMCRQTLDGYLRDRAGVTQTTLDELRKEALDWKVETDRLTPAQSSALQRALDDVTVLDPAVGSGAFLVAMLQEIVLLRRGIWQSERSRDLDRASDQVADWKRHAITHSLFGVDINPMATEICRLRLWLSLVIEREAESFGQIEPLPNLDFRIVAGDSLVDRMGEKPFRESLPLPTMQLGLESNDLQRQIDAWQDQFTTAGNRGDLHRMRELTTSIRTAQLEIARNQVDDALRAARVHLGNLKCTPRTAQRAVRAADAQVANLVALRDNLRPDAPFQKPLLWPITFPNVFEQGGFDIVVANPPYVRQENIGASDEVAFGHAFPEVSTGNPDLLVYFYARALQLLKNGGWLAFITSNKYMRGGYGAGLRQYLPANLQVLQVIDFGDLPLFDVAAYPAVVVGCKTTPPDPDATAQVADLVYPIRKSLRDTAQPASSTNVRTALEDLEQHIVEAHAPKFPQILLRQDGWILADPRIVRLVDRLMSVGTPFHSWAKGRVYRGLTTGLNEAFVIDETTRHQLISQDSRSEERVKPWLRGRDLERWKGLKSGLYCIAIQNSGDSDANNAWGHALERIADNSILVAH